MICFIKSNRKKEHRLFKQGSFFVRLPSFDRDSSWSRTIEWDWSDSISSVVDLLKSNSVGFRDDSLLELRLFEGVNGYGDGVPDLEFEWGLKGSY